jgi:hypothetical protein
LRAASAALSAAARAAATAAESVSDTGAAAFRGRSGGGAGEGGGAARDSEARAMEAAAASCQAVVRALHGAAAAVAGAGAGAPSPADAGALDLDEPRRGGLHYHPAAAAGDALARLTAPGAGRLLLGARVAAAAGLDGWASRGLVGEILRGSVAPPPPPPQQPQPPPPAPPALPRALAASSPPTFFPRPHADPHLWDAPAHSAHPRFRRAVEALLENAWPAWAGWDAPPLTLGMRGDSLYPPHSACAPPLPAPLRSRVAAAAQRVEALRLECPRAPPPAPMRAPPPPAEQQQPPPPVEEAPFWARAQHRVASLFSPPAPAPAHPPPQPTLPEEPPSHHSAAAAAIVAALSSHTHAAPALASLRAFACPAPRGAPTLPLPLPRAPAPPLLLLRLPSAGGPLAAGAGAVGPFFHAPPLRPHTLALLRTWSGVGGRAGGVGEGEALLGALGAPPRAFSWWREAGEEAAAAAAVAEAAAAAAAAARAAAEAERAAREASDARARAAKAILRAAGQLGGEFARASALSIYTATTGSEGSAAAEK